MNLRRLLLAVVMYVALAAAAICAIYSELADFRGRVAVRLGREENIAVAPAIVQPRFETPNTAWNVPPRLIPFNDPDTAWKALPKSENYRVARLPFSVRVDKINVISAPPPRHFLASNGTEPTGLIEIQQGGDVHIGNAQFKVARIGPWSGLMRDPQGVPMAAVTLTSGGPNAPAQTTLFLASGIWQTTPGGAAVYFAWHPGDAEAARSAAAAPPPGLESARWGVIDRGAINWFRSFAPGTGARLSSGEDVTLVAFDEKIPAVAVEIQRGATKRVVSVAANEITDGVPVRFEYPTLAPLVFMVHAWEDGRALVAAYENRQPAGQEELQQGRSFHPAAAPLNLRIDDVLSSAVPVPESESNLWAAVLKSESGEEITLRQGEAKRFDDLLVEYVRLFPPRVVNYILTIDGARQATLKPGQSVRIGDWRLRQAENECDPNTVAVLAAQFTPGRTLATIFAALALTALLLRLADYALRISKRRADRRI
ncbi:MAG: hypothetical protein NTZ09_05530 [Candidatus Hydrogenedentes bacterium]|nr:hypothetical protein [Candidatus Hydrogenedentota bacterium]